MQLHCILNLQYHTKQHLNFPIITEFITNYLDLNDNS